MQREPIEKAPMGNILAVFAEYPFLHRYANLKNIYEANVQRFDEGFLNMRRFPDTSGREADIYLLDEEGELVEQVGGAFIMQHKPLTFLKRLWGHEPEKVVTRKQIYDMETLGETLYRIGKSAQKIKFAVRVYGYPDTSMPRKTLWFIRPKNGFDSIGTWYATLIETKREQIEN